MQVYLDNAATTKLLPPVQEAMKRALDEVYGNPSSLHRMGLEAEKLVKAARKSLAKASGAKEKEIFFTSGGTEANNWALVESVRRHIKRGAHIITTTVEHPSVLETIKRLEAEGASVSYLPVDSNCSIEIDNLLSEIRDNTVLISVMHANNEVGSIMPVDKISQIAKERNIPFHSDCIQTFGKLESLPRAQMRSLSGHKVHGPKGIGALLVDEAYNLPPFILGGGQENRQRSGTENVAGIVGFAAACQAVRAGDLDLAGSEMEKLRNYLADELVSVLPDCRINTPIAGGRALPNILNISFLATKSEVIIHMLEEEGVYISAGSACSAKSSDWSHVLSAMNLNKEAIEGAVRISLSRLTTKEEIDYSCEKIVKAVTNFRKLKARR